MWRNSVLRYALSVQTLKSQQTVGRNRSVYLVLSAVACRGTDKEKGAEASQRILDQEKETEGEIETTDLRVCVDQD